MLDQTEWALQPPPLSPPESPLTAAPPPPSQQDPINRHHHPSFPDCHPSTTGAVFDMGFPATATTTTTTTTALSTQWNSDFPETGDVAPRNRRFPGTESLENCFNNLTIAPPAPQSQQRPSISLPPPPIDRSSMDLMRMRAQSAVSGQLQRQQQQQQVATMYQDFNHYYNTIPTFPDTRMNPNRIAAGPPAVNYYGEMVNCDFPDGRGGPGRPKLIGQGFGDPTGGPKSIRAWEKPSYGTLDLWKLRGNVAAVAREQEGGRFLQKKLKEGRPEEVEFIFVEIKEHLDELMVDPFGNYVIQELFGVCDVDRINQILVALVMNLNVLLRICLNVHGTRVMQKLVDHLTTPNQIAVLVSALRPLTVSLIKSLNGHHIIQNCFKRFPAEQNQILLHEVAKQCLDIAIDRSGCCILQQCLDHSQGEARKSLCLQVAAKALFLSMHPYGNYVVQYILEMRLDYVTTCILGQLVGNFVALSTCKFGSNVVEKCLKNSREDQSEMIIKEIMSSPHFVNLLLNQFGNYVAQSALAVSRGIVHMTLVREIKKHTMSLCNHPHGRRVLKKIESRAASEQQQHNHHQFRV